MSRRWQSSERIRGHSNTLARDRRPIVVAFTTYIGKPLSAARQRPLQQPPNWVSAIADSGATSPALPPHVVLTEQGLTQWQNCWQADICCALAPCVGAMFLTE
jgi:hypothetical protein